MEQNKITNALEKLIQKLYSGEQTYHDVIFDWDDNATNIVITYTLSDRTKVTYSEETKYYEAEIILDIQKIEKDDDNVYYHLQHDVPEYIWDDLIQYEDGKIYVLLSKIVGNIDVDFNITFID
jgi:hypothetical protein